MVRNPELLRGYISSDGFSLDEVCIESRRLGFPCIPSANDDFKTRLIAVSITFLTVLTMELESMDAPSSIDGIAALLGDISSDLVIYGAPRDVIIEAHKLMERVATMAKLVKTSSMPK